MSADPRELVVRAIEYDRAHRDAATAYAVCGGVLLGVGLALLGVPAVSVANIVALPWMILGVVRSRRKHREFMARSQR